MCKQFIVIVLLLFFKFSQGNNPNVIFILIDDLGYGDLSCYGNKKVATPNFDSFAEEGVKFNHFYVNSPVCSPSRVAFTTGQYPSKWGFYTYLSDKNRNEHLGMPDYLDPMAPSLAKILKNNGYVTGHFGKWHMGGGRDVGNAPLPKEYGFDKSLVSFEGLGPRILTKNSGHSLSSSKLGKGPVCWAEKYEKSQMYVDSALVFIKKNVNNPFYVNIWPNDVHDNYIPEPGTYQKYLTVADNTEDAKFLAVLVELDRQVGRVKNTLKELGILENTIIIIASDNGPTDWPKYYKNGGIPPCSQGDHRGRKWSLYEGGINVPFIVHWKNEIKGGITNTETVVSAMDLLPTICSLVNVKLPDKYNFDGIDMSRAFKGKSYKRKKEIFWYFNNVPEPGNEYFISPQFSMLDGNWKLFIEQDTSSAELYNLKSDPLEKKNVINKNKKRTQKMIKSVKAWKKENLLKNRLIISIK